MKMQTSYLHIGLCMGLLVTIGGCRVHAEDATPQDTENASKETSSEEEELVTPVVPGVIKLGTIEESISAASTIEAELKVTVHAESTGRIIALGVEEGDEVKKGQQLARIRYDAQASSLVRARTSLEQAEEDYSRAKQLYRDKALSKEELERAENSYNLAKIDVRDRNREVRNTQVIAPFDGVLTERFVSEGAFVTSGAQLFSVTDFNTLVARVYVPEKELDQIRLGQVALIKSKAAKGRQGTGTIQRIAPIVDASTGTVKITVSLPPELTGLGAFLPGMYAEVILTTAKHENVPLVNKAAVVYDDDRSYLFTIDGDRARKVNVEVGLSDDDHVEILKGPSAGEKIILAGQSGLKDGALIQLVDAQGKPLTEPSQATTSAAG